MSGIRDPAWYMMVRAKVWPIPGALSSNWNTGRSVESLISVFSMRAISSLRTPTTAKLLVIAKARCGSGNCSTTCSAVRRLSSLAGTWVPVLREKKFLTLSKLAVRCRTKKARRRKRSRKARSCLG